MSAYDAVKAKYGYREISIATWRDPRHSVHPARGGPRVLPTVSPESASALFIPYRVKYRPRPPEPTDDEESEEEESEPSLEESPEKRQEVIEEKFQGAVAVQATDDMPPGAEEPKEPELEPGPAIDCSPNEEDASAVASDEAAVVLPVIESSTLEESPGTAPGIAMDNVETAKAVDAVAEASMPPAESDSQTHATQSSIEPLNEDDTTEKLELDLDHDTDKVAQQLPSAAETQSQDSTSVMEESTTTELVQVGTEHADPDTPATEVPPPAPEPPSRIDDATSVEDGAEKKVQFAPGTPEPKPTHRKKKNVKSSKGKKSRKHHPSLEDQESPDDIVAVVDGPCDDSPPPVPLTVTVVAVQPEEGDEEKMGLDTLPTAPIDQEEAKPGEAPHISAPEEAFESLAPPGLARAEQAKDGKSYKRKNKEKSKEKSKKKTSKDKVKVVEAPPIVNGLGIDFGDDSNAAPAIVRVTEPVNIVQEEGEEERVTAEVAKSEDLPPQEESQEVQPETEASQVTMGMTKVEATSSQDMQHSHNIGELLPLSGDQTPNGPLKSPHIATDSGETVDAESPEKKEIKEAVAHSKIETDVTPEDSVGEVESETPPKDNANIVDGSLVSAVALDSDAAAVKTTIVENLAEQQEVLTTPKDEASEPEDVDDFSEVLEDYDSPKVPDSAIDLHEGSAWGEAAQSETEPEAEYDPKIVPASPENAIDGSKAPAGDAELGSETPALVEKLEEFASTAQQPTSNDDGLSQSPIIDDEDDTSEPADEVPLNDGFVEDTGSDKSEPGTPQLDDAAEGDSADPVSPERAPSIEKLTNATEVGDNTESEDEEDAYSTPHEDECITINDEMEDSHGPVVSTDATKDPDVDEVEDLFHAGDSIAPIVGASPDEKSAERIEPVEQETTNSNECMTVDPPEATEKQTEPSEPPGAELIEYRDEAILKDAPCLAESENVDIALVEESLPGDEDTLQDESKDPPPSNGSATLGVIPMEKVPADEDLAAELEVSQIVQNSDKEIMEQVEMEHEAKADLIIVNNVPTISKVVESSLKSKVEADADVDAAVIVPGVADVMSKDLPEPDVPAEVPADAPLPTPPEHTERTLPVILDYMTPTLPALILDSAFLPLKPPSPKVSRSNGSKSKGDRYQTRPSKKHSKDSDKLPRDKKSSKEHRERTPEEIAERQRRKDARRLVESSRQLEEERRRFEEEEMKRMRHEVRRAARKAAAEEYEKLAREEGEAIARREADRRRKRRVSAVRPMERRESDSQPRERRGSKTSGGFFGLGSGKSEKKAGTFGRTESGGTGGRARVSRDGNGARTRRVSLPKDDAVVEDVISKSDEPKISSHDGSSSRRHHRQTENDRAVPRKRDAGELADVERRDDGRRHSSKPEKPKGFFGSLFAKF